jgi:hypothetical protein
MGCSPLTLPSSPFVGSRNHKGGVLRHSLLLPNKKHSGDRSIVSRARMARGLDQNNIMEAEPRPVIYETIQITMIFHCSRSNYEIASWSPDREATTLLQLESALMLQTGLSCLVRIAFQLGWRSASGWVGGKIKALAIVRKEAST